MNHSQEYNLKQMSGTIHNNDFRTRIWLIRKATFAILTVVNPFSDVVNAPLNLKVPQNYFFDK